MTLHSRHAMDALALALIFGAVTTSSSAQIKYASGQDVAPVFEGWERNPDGTFNMVFGYLNRNYEEEVDIPIGPNNTIDPGGERGQPTHFYTRRQRFVFKVVVAKDWDKNRRVGWTLTSRGCTNTVKGWLNPELELDNGVISENSGGGVLEEGNQPPNITGGPAHTITLPNTVTLTVSATDDGLPKPRPQRPARASGDPAAANPNVPNPDTPGRRPRGLGIKWIVYRGPGKVTFEPDSVPAVHGKPVALTTTVSFSAPGAYVLRAIASDGQLASNHEVTVTVNPGGAAQIR